MLGWYNIQWSNDEGNQNLVKTTVAILGLEKIDWHRHKPLQYYTEDLYTDQ